MNKSVVYLFVSVFFLFTSCEYRLGENFMVRLSMIGKTKSLWWNIVVMLLAKSVRCPDLRLRSRSSALERWNGKAMGHDVISCWMWI